MVNYECQRCGYQTINKSYLKRHLLRKNLCKPIMNEIDRYNLLISYGFDEESKLYKKITQSNSNTSSKSNSFECKYCNKKYKYKQGKWKHEQNCNEKNKNDELSLLKEQNKILLDRYKQRDEEILENKKEMRKMMKLIEQLMNKSSNVNNGVINNAQQQINNNNVTINNFGSENIDYITSKVFYKLLNTPYNAIPKLIELKYFHPKHPENHNVKITNIHDKYAKIYKDKKWLLQHKTDVLENMIDNGFADFEEFKDLNEEEFTDKFMEKYKLVEQVIDNGDVKEKILLISKNGTEKIYKNEIVV